jgi:glycine oxidase
MGDLSSLTATVGGAGVFGLAIGLELARRGARVTLADPQPSGRSASAVAAGMLAPALECALDPLAHGRFAILKQARDLWPALAADIGAPLFRHGARLLAPPDTLARVATRLSIEGAAFDRDGDALFTPEDWRVEPGVALPAMRARLVELGGRLVERPVQQAPDADAVVLACGYEARDLAPELAVLTPIRGQLLRFQGGPRDGPVLRTPGGYLAPGQGGAVVGATMDEGRDDLEVDGTSTEHLLSLAQALAPDLPRTPFLPQVGVRAAAPDGLPLVGRSLIKGVWVAAGARRNGWLLAPLVAQIIADLLAGRGKTEAAALFASDRFRPVGGEEP